MQEEIKEIKRTLSDLTVKFEDKFDELSKSVEEQQENAEEKINENTTQEGRIASGKTYSYKFNQAETFEYSCTNHPSMPHGKVVVRG